MKLKLMSYNIQHCLNFITREIDFNMQPDNPKLTPIFDRLYDTADKFSAPKGSYPSDNPGKKIDYILVSRDLTVHNADIPEIVSSDHRPHLAEIEV